MNPLNAFSKVLKSSLIGPSGKKMVMLGGFVFDQREGTNGIVKEWKWVDGEPVFLIYKRTLGRNSPCFLIELNDAHEFAMSSGYATRKLIEDYSYKAAEALGEVNDRSLVFSIIDAIMDGIPTLLKMPPEPKEQEIANRPSTGNDELSIKVDGQTVMEVQV